MAQAVGEALGYELEKIYNKFFSDYRKTYNQMVFVVFYRVMLI
ncbi:hypothetical protein [Staphylococcus aureus]|nr:hypothetical protein [Staphylococcus aureus]